MSPSSVFLFAVLLPSLALAASPPAPPQLAGIGASITSSCGALWAWSPLQQDLVDLGDSAYCGSWFARNQACPFEKIREAVDAAHSLPESRFVTLRFPSGRYLVGRADATAIRDLSLVVQRSRVLVSIEEGAVLYKRGKGYLFEIGYRNGDAAARDLTKIEIRGPGSKVLRTALTLMGSTPKSVPNGGVLVSAARGTTMSELRATGFRVTAFNQYGIVVTGEGALRGLDLDDLFVKTGGGELSPQTGINVFPKLSLKLTQGTSSPNSVTPQEYWTAVAQGASCLRARNIDVTQIDIPGGAKRAATAAIKLQRAKNIWIEGIRATGGTETTFVLDTLDRWRASSLRVVLRQADGLQLGKLRAGALSGAIVERGQNTSSHFNLGVVIAKRAPGAPILESIRLDNVELASQGLQMICLGNPLVSRTEDDGIRMTLSRSTFAGGISVELCRFSEVRLEQIRGPSLRYRGQRWSFSESSSLGQIQEFPD